MSSEYEKQLEEANQRLREQLERETERADKLEKKLKANEWRNLAEPVPAKYTEDISKKLEELYKKIQMNKNA